MCISAPPWAAGAQPPSSWFSLRTEGESLLGHLEHLLPSCCSCLRALRAASLIFFLTPHCQSAFCPFLTHIISEAPPPWLQGSAKACGGGSIGAIWNGLCPAKGSLGCLSQRSLQHPLTAPGHPHLVQHGPDRTKLFGHPLVLCVSRVADSSWSFRGVSFPSFQCSPPLGGNLEPQRHYWS